MPALNYNLRVQQRATYRKVVRYLDAAGVPHPLAAWKARAQIKSAYGLSKPLLDLSTETGEITLTDDGEIIILLTNTQTAALPVAYKNDGPASAIYYYDLFLYAPDGSGRRFMVGLVYVTGALTDAL